MFGIINLNGINNMTNKIEYFNIKIDISGTVHISPICNFYINTVTPVLKNEGNFLELGYMINQVFVNSSIICKNIILNQVEIIDNEFITADLSIFIENGYNRKYKEGIKLKFEIDYYSKWSGLWKIARIIDCLNIYIKEGFDIDTLDSILFESPILLDSINFISLINNLQFKFDAHTICNVGKDDQYWEEITISNLPMNNYISKLFVSILHKYGSLDASLNSTNDIRIKYNRDSGYCSFGCGELPFDEKMANNIKDLLKLNIKEYFDEHKEIVDRMLYYSTINTKTTIIDDNKIKNDKN